MYFSIRENGVKCKICGKQDTSTIEISESALNAIRYTVTAPSKNYIPLV